jgi:hypothetical protein
MTAPPTTPRYPDKVIHEGNGVHSLWRYHGLLNCYALVWPEDDPTAEDVIRKATMIRKGQGRFSGGYFYERG